MALNRALKALCTRKAKDPCTAQRTAHSTPTPPRTGEQHIHCYPEEGTVKALSVVLPVPKSKAAEAARDWKSPYFVVASEEVAEESLEQGCHDAGQPRQSEPEEARVSLGLADRLWGLQISAGAGILILCALGASGALHSGYSSEVPSSVLPQPLLAPWSTDCPTPAPSAVPTLDPTPSPTTASPTVPPGPAPTADLSQAPLYSEEEYVEQKGALFDTGSQIRLLVIGSSNVVWMTWMPKLHLMLKRLGFHLPLLNTTVETDDHLWPICDDTRWFFNLETAHIGKVGFASWDFAYDSWDSCRQQGEARYRSVEGDISVRCGQGVDCENTDKPPSVLRSSLVEDARHADVVVLSQWFNDHKGRTTDPPFKCFNGEEIEKEGTARVAIPHILKLVRAIREASKKVWIVIVAEYPMTQNFEVWDETVPWIRLLNAHVREALENEPRTVFADYPMPSRVELFQKANYGHPNCRGSRLMAQGIVEALYRSKVIARGLKLHRSDERLVSSSCDELSAAACHASAACWLNPVNAACKLYGVGSDTSHSLHEVKAMFQDGGG